MIKLVNVVKSYDGYIAVNNVSLQIEAGSFTGIIGESGAGKSTLLYMIGGLLRPSSGDIFIENVNIVGLNDNELSEFRCNKIGFIFQFYNLVPGMTVRENVELPIIISNRNRKEMKKAVEELVDAVGLSEYIDRDVTTLSGGQQQRVAIARALINDPVVILADEPTGNLDSKNSNKILELLHEINVTKKKTIIMVTHSEKMLKYCDNVITLSDGRVVK
ncbi:MULTISPECIES: ABC transporter ATP-binding protein [Caldicellulosiruptor]|uniref:ABC transporter ATP-binding protein n=2 Tax=Caldicellulosiruptor TaxID=44000 RepID=A0ABY7BF99_9FIRM|nr:MULTISPECIES: ABC transporter ATP-binding protein [Caldicellulosiruptor]WAM30572.1 ABC transporter ATP-binding protein [Caldicellulosiruptor naganoensis]WAM32773.1 ABC transporter ATP-binding protein [Caldicellulosiruptor morganii]